MLENIISDRELSTIIWSGLLISFFIFLSIINKEIREAGFDFIKSFFRLKLVGYQLLMLGYIAGQTYLLFRLGRWHEGMLASTLIWLANPYAMLFKDLTKDWRNPRYLREKLKGLITHTVILEYIIGLKSFPFFAELIITPILVFVAFTYAFTNGKPDYKPLDKFASWMLCIYAIIALGYSVWFLVTDWSFDYLWGFLFTFIMSVLFIPFIFLLRLHTIYENVFMRMTLPKNHNFPKWYARIKGMITFGVNTVTLQRWCDHMVRHSINSRKDVDASISLIKESIKREKNPVKVNIKDGWSPYIIKDCLAAHDLPTETYNCYDDEWGAESSYYDFEGEFLQNTMAYYVSGTQDFATKLKIVFNCSDPNKQTTHLAQLQIRAESLCKSALGLDLPKALASSILSKSTAQTTIKGKEVKVVFNNLPKSRIKNRFGLSFVIQNPDTKTPD